MGDLLLLISPDIDTHSVSPGWLHLSLIMQTVKSSG